MICHFCMFWSWISLEIGQFHQNFLHKLLKLTLKKIFFFHESELWTEKEQTRYILGVYKWSCWCFATYFHIHIIRVKFDKCGFAFSKYQISNLSRRIRVIKSGKAHKNTWCKIRKIENLFQCNEIVKTQFEAS